MEYGLIGERLSHSFSKEIHARLFDYEYELCEIAPEGLDAFMREKNFKAINVTIPYKSAVMPYLDEIDPVAQKIGAVNTVVNCGGRLYGYNTDFSGLMALITRSGVSLAGKKVLILGSGGTSKTALAVCEQLSAREVYRVSRSEGDGVITYSDVYREHLDAEVIINTTPCGMYPHGGESAVEIERFNGLLGCFDAVYNPLCSALVLRARKMGATAEGGLYMLVSQAAFAAEHFTGKAVEKEKIVEIYNDIKKNKQNLVLIGMPASGKSTLGQMVARELSREFIDSDEEIGRKTGKTPAEIIRESGEGAFREIESEVIEKLSARQGIVLATGGGAVLREQNRMALRSNGRVIFLDRPVEQLFLGGDRPLSSSREELSARYSERYGIYCETADVKIACTYSKKENVFKIKEAFLNEN